MSQYYNPHRKASWNYGGSNWRLSRSKIDLFLECPKCFYIDNKLGTKRPPGYPFSLNSAVDTLLKKEFDTHRTNKSTHPLMEQYGIDAVPFEHPKMEEWRDNFQGVAVRHGATGMEVCGAIDDVWITPKNMLLVVDYKSTSKDGEVTLDADWQDGYKRQMEVYQWLLRKSGFDVSDTGYFVYANGDTDKEAFDGRLEFEVQVISYTGSDSWVEGVLGEIKNCLEKDTVPECSDKCDYCAFIDARNKVAAPNKSYEKTTPQETLF